MHPNQYTPEQALAQFWNKVDIDLAEFACWNWKAHRDTWGYGTVRWNSKDQHASRAVWQIAFGPIPNGLLVLHHCDNPACVNPNHLFLGDNKANSDDKMQKGRFVALHGEANGACKLSDVQVAEIRKRYAEGETVLKKLGSQYGVSGTLVWLIVNNKKRRIPTPPNSKQPRRQR